MMWVIGVVLFALAILVSVALHECGHMWVARATGMKVRRYFVGFGPTLWSTRRPNKLGYTEYGVKAVPLGGFCDIAGMTSIDEIAPEDRQYAMYRQKTWKRAAVLFAGPGMNFIIGLVLLYGIALHLGLPEPASPSRRHTSAKPLVSHRRSARTSTAPCAGEGPAAAAGIKSGDIIVKVGDTDVSQPRRDGRRGPRGRAARRRSSYSDDGRRRDSPPSSTSRRPSATRQTPPRPRPRSARSASRPPSSGRSSTRSTTRSPRSRGTVAFTGDLAVELGKSLAKIPTKIGALVHSIGGGERDPETPISVVGASIIGGDAFERGLYLAFWFFLAQLNFVLGRDQPGAPAAVRRRSHRDGLLRKDPQHDPTRAVVGGRGAGELSQADARHLRRSWSSSSATWR